MNRPIKWLAAVCMLFTSFAVAAGAAPAVPGEVPQPARQPLPPLLCAPFDELRTALLDFFDDPGSPDTRAACQSALDAVLIAHVHPNDQLEATRLTSITAGVLGHWEDAVARLREGLSQCPEERIRMGTRFIADFQTLGPLWIAHTLQRAGQAEAALQAYDEAAEAAGTHPTLARVIEMLCRIQQAEIYRLNSNLPDRGIAMLEQLSARKLPDDAMFRDRLSCAFYREWISYVLHALAHPELEMAPDDDYPFLNKYALETHLHLLGIIRPVYPRTETGGERQDLALERAFLRHILSRAASPFLRDACMLRLGHVTTQMEQFAEAETVLRALFDSPSYLAPLGGEFLVNCVRARGDSLGARGISIEYLKRFLNHANMLRRESQRRREQEKLEREQRRQEQSNQHH